MDRFGTGDGPYLLADEGLATLQATVAGTASLVEEFQKVFLSQIAQLLGSVVTR